MSIATVTTSGADPGPEQIRRFVERLDGAAACDDCITERLSLKDRARAAQVTLAMAADQRFERRKDVCALCGTEQATIRHRARGAP